MPDAPNADWGRTSARTRSPKVHQKEHQLKMSRRKFRPLALALAASASLFALIGAAPASAGLLVQNAQDCDSPSTSAVFSPWLDPASYFQAPNGGFEGGSAGWSLGDGASVVNGNNSYNLSGPGSSSLRLTTG